MKSVSLYSKKSSALPAEKVAELVAVRKNQRESAQRIAELKSNISHLTSKHPDCTVAVIKHWVTQKEETVV